MNKNRQEVMARHKRPAVKNYLAVFGQAKHLFWTRTHKERAVSLEEKLFSTKLKKKGIKSSPEQLTRGKRPQLRGLERK